MAILSSLDAAVPFVEATIGYIDPDAPIGAINDAYRAKSTLTVIPKTVRIHDARAVSDRLALERNGFIWLRRATAVSDFGDPDAVRETYLPEAAALVGELTGAERVIVFGHALRNGDPAAPAGTRGPVYNAHVDYNEATIRAVAASRLPAEESERLLAGRIVLINLWRPITPIESAPLALCDASTVAEADLVHGPIGGSTLAGAPDAAGYNVSFNPAHRWYYVPAMQPDEVLAFKLCDTDRDRVQWTAHSSFADPATRPGARPRRSIEIRTLAFLPG